MQGNTNDMIIVINPESQAKLVFLNRPGLCFIFARQQLHLLFLCIVCAVGNRVISHDITNSIDTITTFSLAPNTILIDLHGIFLIVG